MTEHQVPPYFDLDNSSIVSLVGVGMREILIVGSGLVLGIIAGVAIPAGWPVKIAIGTLAAGFGYWLAIAREPGSGRKFEDIFKDMLRFRRRPRVYQRDYVPGPEEGDMFSAQDLYDSQVPDTAADWAVDQLPDYGTLPAATDWFKIRSMPLTIGGILNVLGLALAAGILTWVWLGGLKTLLASISGF